MMDIINVDYREKIPNNVNLTEDRRVLKALEGWHPGYLDWWQRHGAGGLPGIARLSAHRGLGRSQGLGQVRLHQDAGIPLGHPAGAAGGGPQDSVRRSISASRCGRRCRANTAPCSAASSSSRATPSRRRSSSSAISARPRRRSTTCATCSRSTSRRAATSGRWSICCTSISAATAATRPTTCCAAAPAARTRRACSAPSTRRRRTGCRCSCSPSSPTATARCSSSRWRNPASIRCRAPAASC